VFSWTYGQIFLNGRSCADRLPRGSRRNKKTTLFSRSTIKIPNFQRTYSHWVEVKRKKDPDLATFFLSFLVSEKFKKRAREVSPHSFSPFGIELNDFEKLFFPKTVLNRFWKNFHKKFRKISAAKTFFVDVQKF